MADNKLHTAVRYGNEEETLQALREGLNPNEIGLLNWSPVHEAAHNGERDILKLLILFKGDVNQKDGLHGNTPLHYAAQEDNSACVTVLLNAGARWDVQNELGKTPLDVTTSSCRERFEPFLNSESHGATKDWSPAGGKDNAPRDKTTDTAAQNQWEGLDDVPSNAAIGSLHLSFEFHKATLKVRVWQITDLLLPPPQTSMIQSIFVRGYLIPDPAKKSQRKTEDIPVDPTAKDVNGKSNPMPQAGIQHIFTPSSFRFNNPLLYTCVTDEIVAQRSIQLEVCMTQKHTRKTFLVAMVHMPLRTAVRRPIRDKYPLIPCMNYTIPNSMRVYSAKDIFIEGTSEDAPRFSRSISAQSNPGSLSDISNSSKDNPLESVESETPIRKVISVNLSLGEDSSDGEYIDDGIGSSMDVICSGKESTASSVITVDVGDSNNPDDIEGLQSVVVADDNDTRSSQHSSFVDMEGVVQDSITAVPKKKIIPTGMSLKTSEDNELEVTEVRVPSNQNNQNVKDVTVIEVEENVKDTVVDMSQLNRDTVLDMDGMTDSGYDNESFQSESPVSETKQASSSSPRKKKIIPTEVNASQDVEDENTLDQEEDEITVEINSSPCHSQSTSSQPLSPNSKEDASPAASSRPETPVWDFYDFTCDDATSADKDLPSATANSESCQTTSSSGTLQESLARLSRPQPVLDTCLVSGPVLPSVVLVEDFEMDDEG